MNKDVEKLAKILFKSKGGDNWDISECDCSTVKKYCYGEECDYDLKQEAIEEAKIILDAGYVYKE